MNQEQEKPDLPLLRYQVQLLAKTVEEDHSPKIGRHETWINNTDLRMRVYRKVAIAVLCALVLAIVYVRGGIDAVLAALLR